MNRCPPSTPPHAGVPAAAAPAAVPAAAAHSRRRVCCLALLAAALAGIALLCLPGVVPARRAARVRPPLIALVLVALATAGTLAWGDDEPARQR